MVDICVVGSLNLDLVVCAPRVPRAGETVLGGDLARIPGGKGANQAVAAARLGRTVSMIGRIGDDDAGTILRSALVSGGVDDTGILTTAGTASGAALIVVQDDGDNAIVVSPGANGRLTAADVDRHGAVAAASVVLGQAEVPAEATMAAARQCSGVFVWNPAPVPDWAGEVLPEVDILVPNESELAGLVGGRVPANDREMVDLARSTGCPVVVVTLGAGGALVVQEDSATHVPAPALDPVDTTGAGDAFCAGLADGLVKGIPLVDAVRWAVQVGAATTLVAGAQPSLPTPTEVDERLRHRAPRQT